MSVPEPTGRARAGHGCRWCGPRAETIKYEVRDSGTAGSEVVCCTCGKSQYRWGWEEQFWADEIHKEIVRGVLVNAWLAAQVVRLAGQVPSRPEQLGLFEAVAS